MSNTHKWTVQIKGEEPPQQCESYTNQADCLANNCYWYNNSCHSNPQPPQQCEDYNNQTDCLANNCYWYNNSCHSSPPPQQCENYTNQADCLANNCYWYNNSCHSSPEPQPPGPDTQKNAIIAIALVCAGIGGTYLVSELKTREVI